MSYTVNIDHIVKQFGNFRAVDDVTMQVEEGEFFTLLGPSGCGKTTLLRMIAGFHAVDSGTISFGLKVMNHEPAYNRNIGMVFQNYAIFPHMSVRENVAYGLKSRKVRGEELKNRVQDAMAKMKIDAYADRAPDQLSGGQQQRVALARAIVIHPGVLLMDEPLSNLDAKLRVEMRTMIRKLQKELNITTIYVTHDQEEALAVSDRIAVMDNGKIMQLDTPDRIYMYPRNRFVAGFIGTSNFLEAHIQNHTVELKQGMKLPGMSRCDYNGEVLLSVRPEFVRMTEADSETLTGTISLRTFLGDKVVYEICLSDGESLTATEYMQEDLHLRKPGETVGIKFVHQWVNLFRKDTGEVLNR